MSKHKERYYLIDAIRGFTIVNMILFHFMYDVNISYGHDLTWYGYKSTHIWQQFICCTFILIAGFVWHVGSRHNLRRGIMLNLWGGIITLTTTLVMPGDAIWFGILNFIGCSVLLLIPLHRFFQKLLPLPALLLSLLCFLFFYNIQSGYLGFGNIQLVTIPEKLYHFRVLTILGLPHPDFHSSDYFPLFPWFFLFCCGYFLFRLFKEQEIFKKLGSVKVPLLSAIGQKSLLIYLLHQPLLMLLCIIMYGF